MYEIVASEKWTVQIWLLQSQSIYNPKWISAMQLIFMIANEEKMVAEKKQA